MHLRDDGPTPFSLVTFARCGGIRLAARPSSGRRSGDARLGLAFDGNTRSGRSTSSTSTAPRIGSSSSGVCAVPPSADPATSTARCTRGPKSRRTTRLGRLGSRRRSACGSCGCRRGSSSATWPRPLGASGRRWGDVATFATHRPPPRGLVRRGTPHCPRASVRPRGCSDVLLVCLRRRTHPSTNRGPAGERKAPGPRRPHSSNPRRPRATSAARRAAASA